MPLLQCRDDIRFCIGSFCICITSRNRNGKLCGLCFICAVCIADLVKSFYGLGLQRFVNGAVTSDDLLIICIKLYRISFRNGRHRNLCRICIHNRCCHSSSDLLCIGSLIRQIPFKYLQFINRNCLPVFHRLDSGNIQTQIFCCHCLIQCDGISCICRCLCSAGYIGPGLSVIGNLKCICCCILTFPVDTEALHGLCFIPFKLYPGCRRYIM